MNEFNKNIKFNYLYRDAGNYKQYGAVVFVNPKNLSASEVERKIRARLIDGEFFEPSKWKLTALGFEEWNDDLEHFWNEFESVQSTSEEPTTNKTIENFLRDIYS